MDHAQLIETCESLVREGRGQVALGHLRKLNSARIPREYRLPLANLCRRTGSLSMGLRLLSPVLNIERNRLKEPPRAAELAEYAMLLQRIGAVSEALAVLQKVDLEIVPQAHLYFAFCYFNRWEHAKAIPYLRSMLSKVTDPYANFVGRVNLSAALWETAIGTNRSPHFPRTSKSPSRAATIAFRQIRTNSAPKFTFTSKTTAKPVKSSIARRS